MAESSEVVLYKNPMQSMVSMGSNGNGDMVDAEMNGEGGPVGPFETLVYILEEMRDGVASIATDMKELVGVFKPDAGQAAQASVDRAETEGTGEKEEGEQGKSWFAGLQNAMTGLLPKGGFGDKLKILAFLGILWALSKYQEIIIPKLAKVLEKLKAIALWFTEQDEEGNVIGIDWSKVLLAGAGVMITKMLLGMAFSPAGAMLGIAGFKKLMPLMLKGGKLLGPLGVAAYGIYAAYQIAGDAAAAADWTEGKGASDKKWANMIGGALGGKLEGGIMNAFVQGGKWAGPFALAGMAIGSVVPVVGTLIGGLVGGVIGFAFGAIMGWFGGGKIARFFSDIGDWVSEKWNNLTQGIKDIFFDREVTTMVGGREMKHTQRSAVGQLQDKMTEWRENMEVWLNNIWDKLTGWIPSWEDVTKKWDDMGEKVDLWKDNMQQWFVDMWEKLTGWIPSVDDIKAAGGDLMAWTKGIVDDIKLWFWDSSKPQIIGIDMSKIAAAMPSMAEIQEAIISSLPKWMRPNTLMEKIEDKKADIAERQDEIRRSEAGENVFAGVDKWRIESKKEALAEKQLELAELEAEAASMGIATGSNDISISKGSETTSGAELTQHMRVAMADRLSSKSGGAVIVDAKKVNSENIEHKQTTIVPSDTDDRSASAKAAEMRGY